MHRQLLLLHSPEVRPCTWPQTTSTSTSTPQCRRPPPHRTGRSDHHEKTRALSKRDEQRVDTDFNIKRTLVKAENRPPTKKACHGPCVLFSQHQWQGVWSTSPRAHLRCHQHARLPNVVHTVKIQVGQRLGRHDLEAELQRSGGDSGFVSRAHLEGRRIRHLRGRAAYHTCLGIEVDTLRQRWTNTVLVHVAFHAGLHGHGNKVRVDGCLARIRQARGWCTRDSKRDPCSGLPILVFFCCNLAGPLRRDLAGGEGGVRKPHCQRGSRLGARWSEASLWGTNAGPARGNRC